MKKKLLKSTRDAAVSPSGLVAAGISQGFALFIAVVISANISGGHVTFGLFVAVIVVDRVSLLQVDAADLVRDASLNDRVELRIVGDVGAKIRILGLTSPGVQKISATLVVFLHGRGLFLH
ncbi:hypothetical protein ACS0TY_000046 [Phlomoides rotata]